MAVNKKRCIVRDIVHYVFSQKLSITPDKYIYIADQAESVLENTFVSSNRFITLSTKLYLF